ncbi:MAG: glycosyltransferase family 4 protein [Elusimicrobia bacterium]|nr:glycosyltransferase family 4 protein [Elusimicrobiota bacterium]
MTPRIVFLSHLDFNLYRLRLPVMKALVERGWLVAAVCPPGRFSPLFEKEGVRHVPYAIERGSMNPLKEAAVVSRLATVMTTLRPHLLHTFTMKPNIYGALAARWAGVPRVVASVTGLGSFYDRSADARVGVFRRMLDVLYRGALTKADRVIFYNEDDKAELIRLGVCPPRKAVIIHGSGVDVDRYRPAPRRTGEGPVVVSMMARLIIDKGIHEFLDAARILKERWMDRVVFQLGGEEDPGNPWQADARRIETAVSKGAVRRLGFVDDVPALMAGTDVFAFPSYYREGIPMAVLEAMSCGLAVVTTDSPGCRETIVDGESGLRVPPRDAAALTAALERLIGDAALRARLGDGARRRVEERFSSGKIIEAHLAVYRELLPEAGL